MITFQDELKVVSDRWRFDMKNKLLVLTMISLLGTVAWGAEAKHRVYQFKTTANAFRCESGVPNNGHNYPTATLIYLSTQYAASSIYFPTKLPLNNTEFVTFYDQSARPCSDHSDLLKAKGDSEGYLEGEAVQDFSESLVRVGTGECFKRIREDLTIRVKGYTFKGSGEFNLPMDSADCR